MNNPTTPTLAEAIRARDEAKKKYLADWDKSSADRARSDDAYRAYEEAEIALSEAYRACASSAFTALPVTLDGDDAGEYQATGIYDRSAPNYDRVEIHALAGECGEPIRLCVSMIEAAEKAVEELLRDHSRDAADAKGDADFHDWQDEHEPGETFKGR